MEEIAPAPSKLTDAERGRLQELVEKQLPNLEKQLPNLTEKIWAIIKQSIGGFLGITGFLLSLVSGASIYLFFLLQQRPAIQARRKDYLPLRNSPLKDEVADVLLPDQQLHHRLFSWTTPRLPRRWHSDWLQPSRFFLRPD